jgi:hypothetical protein
LGSDDWVGELCADLAWTGRGLGTGLLEPARQRRPGGLQLQRARQQRSTRKAAAWLFYLFTVIPQLAEEIDRRRQYHGE